MTATIERTPAVKRTPAATIAPAAHTETTRQKATRYVWAGLRLALGWVFLWAFLDKMFGLGHETPAKNAWINGGSPTKGFLGNAVEGPFAGFYQNLAGAAWADTLFMVGLLGIGVALMLGIGIRVAAVAGGLLLGLMWRTTPSWTTTSSTRACWPAWPWWAPATPSASAGSGRGSPWSSVSPG